EEEVFHLPGEVLARPLIGEIETILVDQHRLMLEPRRPGFLAHRGVDPLAELAGIGCEIETGGLAFQVDALNSSRHFSVSVLNCKSQASFLTNTCERRSQLYLRLRASGSQSASTWTNPRLM